MANDKDRGWVIAWFFLLTGLVSSAKAVEYLTSNCGRTLYTGSSGGILNSQPRQEYDNNVDCTLTIRASGFDQRIRLTFRRVSIEEGGTYNSCGHDSLEVYDGSDVYEPVLATICGKSADDIVSTSRAITLRFRTDASVTYRGFLLAYIPFETVSTDEDCDWDECDNYRCADSSLKSNSYDNCGDNSDNNSSGGASVSWTFDGDGVIVLSCAVVIVLLVACVVCFIKVRRRRRLAQRPAVVVYQQPQRDGAAPSDYNEQPPVAMQASGQPGQPAVYPTQPVPYPTQPTSYPTQPAAYPTQPTPYPTQPAPYPTQPAANPTQPAEYQTQPPPPYPGQPDSYPNQPENYPAPSAPPENF